MPFLHCGPYRLTLQRPLIMGIVNMTPDSFSGDGLGGDTQSAIAHARRQREAGADMLDLGAESTRPGAMPTAEADELKRLLPVLEEVTTWGLPISVDTCKPAVMRAALTAGAAMINDITALRDPEALAAVAESDCAICLMHMQGEPRTMQAAPVYGDVVAEVRQFLAAAVDRCRRAGIADERLVLDPGFGFGKTLEHNLALLRRIKAATIDDLPLLAGLSRKSML
ncbi:MAG: dihydropteroate synthase, partial [Azonexus sp.]|nr:dihydropteroate synthase [Azonexus sp.]